MQQRALDARGTAKARATDVAVSYLYRMPDDRSRAGGDYVATYRRDDGAVALVVGDLWAKGSAGDYFASSMRRAFRSAAAETVSPSGIVASINNALVDDLRVRGVFVGFCSIFVASFAPDGAFAYAAAGTDTALLFRGAAHHAHLEPTGPLAGLERDVPYVECSARFDPGATLVAFTDGISESRSAGNRQRLLGTAGLARLVRRASATREGATCRGIMREVEIWNGSAFFDDATVAVVHRIG